MWIVWNKPDRLIVLIHAAGGVQCAADFGEMVLVIIWKNTWGLYAALTPWALIRISICIKYPCKVSQFYNRLLDPRLSQKVSRASQGDGKQILLEQQEPSCARLAGENWCPQNKWTRRHAGSLQQGLWKLELLQHLVGCWIPDCFL